MKKFVEKNSKGITLIALVITIILLLILAGITISQLTGTGLFGKAKRAKIISDYTTAKEIIKLELMSIHTECIKEENDYNIITIEKGMEKPNHITIDNIYYSNTAKLKSGLELDINRKEYLVGILVSVDQYSQYKFLIGKGGDIEKAVQDEIPDTIEDEKLKPIDEFERDVIGIIPEKDNGNSSTPEVPETPDNPEITEVSNEPYLDGFDKTKAYYVSWDLDDESKEYVPNEKKILENSEPNNWYNYTAGVNQWANIKTVGGGNDCYWVWIPRYAYKVPTKGNTAETIEVKFLQGKTNKPIGETTEITNTIPTPGTWVVHPAFTTLGNGGFGELTGIWVAKFEASSSIVSETTVISDLATTGGGDVTNLQVRVKPNVTSWREITVNNIFTVCRNLTEEGNSLENTSNLNSHMMKNTEWGAVAYLSMSVYGKNSEVWNNPYYNNTTNCSPITGLCSNETNGKDNGMTDITKTCKYNEVGGGNASTTGNVYGVYDMAGGALEYVAGIYKGTTSDNLGNNTNRSNLWDSSNSKYVDQYTETTGSQSTYYENTNKYGDAVYETSSSGDSSTGSWDSSDSGFPDSSHPMFIRGGPAFNGSSAGVFAFGSFAGKANNSISFRPVVLSSQL